MQELQQRGAVLASVAAQFGVAAPEGGPVDGLGAGGPLPREEALAVIIANERGRQGRARFAAQRAARAAQQREELRAKEGTVRVSCLSARTAVRRGKTRLWNMSPVLACQEETRPLSAAAEAAHASLHSNP